MLSATDDDVLFEESGSSDSTIVIIIVIWVVQNLWDSTTSRNFILHGQITCQFELQMWTEFLEICHLKSWWPSGLEIMAYL